VKKELQIMIAIFPILFLILGGQPHAQGYPKVADTFKVEVIQADNSDLNKAKSVKSIMSFTGALKLTENVKLSMGTSHSNVTWTADKAYIASFSQGGKSSVIKTSGKCPVIKDNKPLEDTFNMTIISAPNNPNADLYYRYVKLQEERVVKLGHCKYTFPSTIALEAMEGLPLSVGHERTIFAGKVNDHYIHFRISRLPG